MDPVAQLAEQRIREAQERGEFDDLPGAGRPLALDDDNLIPEELRAGYRLLKNAGFLPPDLQLHAEIRDAEALLCRIEDSAERSRAQARLDWLRIQLDCRRGGRSRPGRDRLDLADYQPALLERLERD